MTEKESETEMEMGTEQREKRDLTPTNDDEGVGEWSAGKYELIPADDHEVKFQGFRIEQHEQYGQRLCLIFDTSEIAMDDGSPYRVTTWAGATFSPRGKIRPMLAAMGVDVDSIDLNTFKLSAYQGGRLRLNITHEKVQGKDGPYDAARISGFLKSKSGKRQPWEPKATAKPDAATAERKRQVLTDEDDD